MPSRRSLVDDAPKLLPASSLSLPPIPRAAVLSHGTAATLRGLPLLQPSDVPALLIPRSNHSAGPAWASHWADLGADDVDMSPDGVLVTSALRTLCDCGRTMPLYDAVAMIDAGLRMGLVSLGQLRNAAQAARGKGVGALRRAVSWCSPLADSPQESVGRIALRLVGIRATPQFFLRDGPYEHPFDLGIAWAKVVIDMQSKAAHASWPAVRKDIGIQGLVTLTRGWELALSVPDEVLPDPSRFVANVLAVVVAQPGRQCSRMRARHLDADGDVRFPWEVQPGAVELRWT